MAIITNREAANLVLKAFIPNDDNNSVALHDWAIEFIRKLDEKNAHRTPDEIAAAEEREALKEQIYELCKGQKLCVKQIAETVGVDWHKVNPLLTGANGLVKQGRMNVEVGIYNNNKVNFYISAE